MLNLSKINLHNLFADKNTLTYFKNNNFAKKMSKNFYIPLIILSVFFSAAMSVLIKLAQQDTNVFTAAFLRFFLE